MVEENKARHSVRLAPNPADRHDQDCSPKSQSIRYPTIPQRSLLYKVILLSKRRTAPREPFERHQGCDLRGCQLAHAQFSPQGP